MGLTGVIRRLDSLRDIFHRVREISVFERLDDMNRNQVGDSLFSTFLVHSSTRGYSEQSNSNQGSKDGKAIIPNRSTAR